MSSCKDCAKSFASRQSLSNHRKRMHNDNAQNLKLSGQLFSDSLHKNREAEEKKGVKKVIDAILSVAPPKDVQDTSSSVAKIAKLSADKKVRKVDAKDVQDVSPPVGKIAKLSAESDESDSDDSDTEGVEDIKVPKDKENQDSLLIDAFHKLYSHFDEDDVEMCNDILQLLDALKVRGCVTDREYAHIKSLLSQQIRLNLYESINSTVENMTRDDKNEILGLLRSMTKDKEAKKLMALVKDYFEEEMELESVLLLLPKLKDKLDALKLEIILKNIEKTRNRVEEIFTRITSGEDKGETLKSLRDTNRITDEQYDKLSIGPHTLPSISRIVQGRGMYLSKKSHTIL